MYIDEDMSQKEIAEQCGVSDSTVSNWVRKFDIEKEPDHPWRDQEYLHELYWERELSIHEIADKLDTYANIIHKWLCHYDIPRRKQQREDREYYDKGLLKRLYWDEGLSQREIAERYGTHQTTISEIMSELRVETKQWYEAGADAKRVNRAYFRTNRSGYEVVGSRCGEVTHQVQVHQLVAITEYGFDAVCENVVHHRNEISWDNRIENLELMADSEHKRHHATTRGEKPPEGF